MLENPICFNCSAEYKDGARQCKCTDEEVSQAVEELLEEAYKRDSEYYGD